MNSAISPSETMPIDPLEVSASTGTRMPALASRVVPASTAKLAVRGLTMRYPSGQMALNNFSLTVEAGEMVVVLGSNGCGKSTFMKCVVGLNRPTDGEVAVAGRNLTSLAGRTLREARMPLALISQNANLVKRRSVLANVSYGALGRHRTPMTAFGWMPRDEIETARNCLKEVGLLHLAKQRAGTLSGGQAQRVAVARALVQRPQVLLADEPVASLDPEAADEVMRLLRRLATEEGLAVVCVLHQNDLAMRYADRLVGLRRGRMEFDCPRSDVLSHQVSRLYVDAAS
jgi:phosphonate transport system ATP-binding protein